CHLQTANTQTLGESPVSLVCETMPFLGRGANTSPSGMCIPLAVSFKGLLPLKPEPPDPL
ncbi:hypothetical protein NDU88_001216, partial [Pleurodeles waltl]